MKTDELIMALQKLKVQTGSLACLGCGHEHNCGVHGCALIREAVTKLIEQNGWINPKEHLPERGVPVDVQQMGTRPSGNTAHLGRAAVFCRRTESRNRCAVLAAATAVAGGAGMTITDLLVNLDCILWLVLFFIVLHRVNFWDGKFSELHEELLRTIREEDKE